MNFEKLQETEDGICEAYSDLIRALSNEQLKERLRFMRDRKLANLEKLEPNVSEKKV